MQSSTRPGSRQYIVQAPSLLRGNLESVLSEELAGIFAEQANDVLTRRQPGGRQQNGERAVTIPCQIAHALDPPLSSGQHVNRKRAVTPARLNLDPKRDL